MSSTRCALRQVYAGTRVVSMERGEDNLWVLEGIGGVAAYHDTPEDEASKAVARPLGAFHAVLLTDVSSSFDSW